MGYIIASTTWVCSGRAQVWTRVKLGKQRLESMYSVSAIGCHNSLHLINYGIYVA